MISIMNCSFFLCNFFFFWYFFVCSPRGFNLDKQTSHKKCFNMSQNGAQNSLLFFLLLLLLLVVVSVVGGFKTSCVVHLA